MALRVEIQEVKHLYDIGLINHYTYMDIKSTLQRDRDDWLEDPQHLLRYEIQPRKSLFARIENGLIKKLREKRQPDRCFVTLSILSTVTTSTKGPGGCHDLLCCAGYVAG